MMNSIEFKINHKIANWLGENNIQIEELFILICFSDIEKYMEIYNLYLQSKTSDQKLVYLQKLVRKQLLNVDYDVEEYHLDNYNVSDFGLKVLSFIQDQGAIEEISIISQEGEEEKILELNEFEKFVEDFRNKFPEGRNGGGVSFRGNHMDIKSKLTKFMNKYKYDKETILIATDDYLTGFRGKGYHYCQAAEYFILKNNTSALANHCENVKKGKGKTSVDVWEQQM